MLQTFLCKVPCQFLGWQEFGEQSTGMVLSMLLTIRRNPVPAILTNTVRLSSGSESQCVLILRAFGLYRLASLSVNVFAASQYLDGPGDGAGRPHYPT